MVLGYYSKSNKDTVFSITKCKKECMEYIYY